MSFVSFQKPTPSKKQQQQALKRKSLFIPVQKRCFAKPKNKASLRFHRSQSKPLAEGSCCSAWRGTGALCDITKGHSPTQSLFTPSENGAGKLSCPFFKIDLFKKKLIQTVPLLYLNLSLKMLLQTVFFKCVEN